MKRLPMSKAAAGLLRAMLNRAGTGADRILLTEIESTDWQSLTFVGERHCFCFQIGGAGAAELFEQVTQGLGDAEFRIAGQIVADIALQAPAKLDDRGSIAFTIEALTIFE